jgi:hypothetical protein
MKQTPKNKINKYIWFTWDACGLHIAKKLKDEGNTVILAQIKTKKELGLPHDKPEKPEDEKIRLSIGDGIIEKHDAVDILKKMKSMKNKDEWFVVFDFNNLWRYGEAVAKMGFDNIFYPTRAQWEMEEDRNAGKEFVQKNYPDLKVAEVHEFKTIEEGISFLENTEKVWVLKSYNPAGSTIVPASDDADKAHEEIVGALEIEKTDYEKDGFILEEMIPSPIEITPEIQFYNGKVIMTTVDIENKPIGAASTGNMTGCSSNLIIKTDIEEKINKIAFPPAVYEMAKKHKGLFVWDSSILINPKTKELYFGEFCANRWGWDSFFTNLAMCDSVSSFFNSILEGKNPLTSNYGVAVRMFNLKSYIDVPVILGEEGDKNVWFYDVKKVDGKYFTCGLGWDTYVVTGAGNTLSEAIDEAYEEIADTTLTNGYYRPKFDFISKEYSNSIMNRHFVGSGWLYGSPMLEDEVGLDEVIFKRLKESINQAIDSNKSSIIVKNTPKQEMEGQAKGYEEKMLKMRTEHAKEIDSLTQQIKDILES